MRSFVGLGLLLTVATFVFIGGCGRNNYPTTVKIQAKVMLDGKPLPNVMVTFMPTDGKRSATGMSDDQGNVSEMSTFAPNDGVVPTSHQIAVNPKEAPPMGGFEIGDMEGSTKSGASRYVPPFPPRYFVPATSEITATVEANGPNEFTFDLKSK